MTHLNQLRPLLAAVLALTTVACAAPTGEEAGATGAELRPRLIDFPSLRCRDAQGDGADLYMFRNENLYSQVTFYENGAPSLSTWADQEVIQRDFVAYFTFSESSNIPRGTRLVFGAQPYVFVSGDRSFPCVEGQYFEACVGLTCLQPPVFVDAPAENGATVESMQAALEALRPRVRSCAPRFRGGVSIEAQFGQDGRVANVDVYASRLRFREIACMERVLQSASGASGEGEIDYVMSF